MSAYQVHIYRTGIERKEAQRIADIMRYHSGKVGVNWFMAYSRTDSKTAKPVFIHTGKRGRPSKRITGRPVEAHIHCCVQGEHAYTAGERISKAINKRYNGKITRLQSMDAEHLKQFIVYSTKQAEMIRTG